MTTVVVMYLLYIPSSLLWLLSSILFLSPVASSSVSVSSLISPPVPCARINSSFFFPIINFYICIFYMVYNYFTNTYVIHKTKHHHYLCLNHYSFVFLAFSSYSCCLSLHCSSYSSHCHSSYSQVSVLQNMLLTIQDLNNSTSLLLL